MKKADLSNNLAAIRLKKVLDARHSLLAFTELMHPDPVDTSDARLTQYVTAPHHKVIANALEKVANASDQRVILELPPRHGKTELASTNFPAWILGRRPDSQVILASYNQRLAEKIGRKCRDILLRPSYRQIFPNVKVDPGNKSASEIGLENGGYALFLGTGGGLTGHGAHLLVIDDPLKGFEEANSQLVRDNLWEWFQSDAYTRLMPGGSVIIIQTRWSPDDLVGRLLDPTNDYYDAKEAKKWTRIKLPALLDNPKTGEKEAIPLWPKHEANGQQFGWDRDYFLDIKRQSPRTYWALYQQEPQALDGDYFKREWFKFYRADEKPSNLRIYAASDHAVSTKQDADFTVMMVAGVDEEDNIYVLDMVRRRMDAEEAVDQMLLMMRRYKPIVWWAEKGHISQSIGPFLRKRMLETRTYINVQDMTPVKDKATRARSIQGRMSMGKVMFPRGALWWRDMENELLKFPMGQHDDMIDCVAYIGLGLDQIVPATCIKSKVIVPKTGTWGWIKWASKMEENERNRKSACGGL